MRIAIVNDMLLAVEALRRVLITVPEFEIAWIARNGAEAVKKCAADTPDLILMDLLMPVMDGVEATRTIMNNNPCAILIVTATVTGNNSKVFQAMGYGALDAVNTPTLGTTGNPEGGAHLLAKIRTISKLIGKSVTQQFTSNLDRKTAVISTTTPHLIAIGSSTGGPQALATLLSGFSLDLPAAIVIVQHVNAQFSVGLAEWLSNQIKLPVSIARAGMPVQKGKILMAGTNDHLVLQPNLTLKYTPEPRDNPYRPSVDAFFKSLAEYWPTKGTAVLLTGMGKDGADGLMCLRSAGWHTIAQDRSTSVVYGMPKAAASLGAAVEILPVDAIANAIQKRLVYSQ